MQPTGSACNSPLLSRAYRHGSVSREASVDPEYAYCSGADSDCYAFEKDRVIGELAKRMKKKVAPGRTEKHRRGDTEDDVFHFGTLGGGEFRLDVSTPPPEENKVCLDRTYSSDSASSEYLREETPEPVAASPLNTASINPQRTATASIRLAPSPRVTRARSSSPNPRMSTCRGINITSTARTGPANSATRPARLNPNRASPMRSISVQSSSRSNSSSSSSTNTNGSAASRSPLSAVSNNNSGSRTKLNNGGSLHPPTTLGRSISADPSMLTDPSVQAKIGSRATKVVQSSLGKCPTCNKSIQEDGCTAFGKVYHKACFKCFVCKQKIQGKFFEKDGKPYCAKDYQKSMDSCTVCNQPIKGDSVVSNNKSFHPECMECYVCGERLRGVFFTFEDKPICEKDYKQQAEACAGCGEAPTGTCYSANGQVFCEECHQKQCDRCPKCEKEVLGKCVRVSGAAFHPDCFSCTVCKKNMINVPFVADDKNQIYCTEDYNKKKAPRCSFCKKPIVPKDGQKTAPRLRALGKDFHPECFQCEDCGLVLDARVKGKECYPFKNRLYCLKCNRKKLSSEEESESDDEN
jgi:hypothetical protein